MAAYIDIYDVICMTLCLMTSLTYLVVVPFIWLALTLFCFDCDVTKALIPLNLIRLEKRCKIRGVLMKDQFLLLKWFRTI